ncbi:hypothetical protein BH10PSE14_BH10PSE14_26500 [soil metagenome]
MSDGKPMAGWEEPARRFLRRNLLVGYKAWRSLFVLLKPKIGKADIACTESAHVVVISVATLGKTEGAQMWRDLKY